MLDKLEFIFKLLIYLILTLIALPLVIIYMVWILQAKYRKY